MVIIKKYIEVLKFELHCHLDGSLRAKSVLEEARKNNIEISFNEVELADKLQAPMDCKSLKEYLDTFTLPLMVMQNKDSISRLTYEVFEDAHKENVKYLELRFAPVLHTDKGLHEEEVIESVIEGMNKAKKEFGIEGSIILCCMKHLDENKALHTINAGKRYLNYGVSAVDLAGGEYEGFAKDFRNAFYKAKELDYNITIHAGEAASSKNVIDSINMLYADRIGHGVRIISDKGAMDLVKEKNVMLEVCPTSNIQTKAVESIDMHPIKDFYYDNVLFSINTDNRTVSNTTMTNEIDISSHLINFDLEGYKDICKNTINFSFASKEVKNNLLKIVNNIGGV